MPCPATVTSRVRVRSWSSRTPPPTTAATARTRARWCLGASRSQHDRPLLPRQRNWESTTKQARYFWSRRTTTGQRA